MLTAEQITELRASVARGYQHPLDPFRIVKLQGGPLDSIRVKVDANLKAGASVAFIYHHGRGYVTADYRRDDIGRWLIQTRVIKAYKGIRENRRAFKPDGELERDRDFERPYPGHNRACVALKNRTLL